MLIKNHDILFPCPLGRIGIRLESGAVASLDFLPPGCERFPADAIATHVVEVLRAYFTDPLSSCVLPIVPQGTSFQRRVWDALRGIPPGQVVTYGILAQRLDTSARAVGGACKANPVPIIIPCHRVVAKTGLGGYSGDENHGRPDIKRWLLVHEAVLNDELGTDIGGARFSC